MKSFNLRDKRTELMKENISIRFYKIRLLSLVFVFCAVPYSAQEKGSNPGKDGNKIQADFILEGRNGNQNYFVDETSIAEIYPKSSSKPKNVKSEKNSADNLQKSSSSEQLSGSVRIVRNQDQSLINSLKNRSSVRKNSKGAKLSPVFQHLPGGMSFVLAGGIEILFPETVNSSEIESWLLSKGLRGKAIFPNSKVYIIESEEGFSALDLANLIAKDPFPLEVAPLKTREMSLK